MQPAASSPPHVDHWPAANLRVHRLWACLCITLVALLTCTLTAWAQTPAPISANKLLVIDRLEAIAGVDSSLTLSQVLGGQAGAFQPQRSTTLEDPAWSKSLWVKVYLRPASTSNEGAIASNVLELHKRLNDVSLYTPVLSPKGWQWQAQHAGMRHPPKEDALHSPFPLFVLPSASEMADRPEAMQFLLLHIEHHLPVTLTVSARPITQVLLQTNASSWLMGLALGAIALVCIMTGALAWLHRDSVYASYAAYASAAWLFCASYSGLADQYLWPVGGEWPLTAIPFWLLVAMLCKLQFCRLVFLPPDKHSTLHWACNLLGGIGAMVGIGYIVQEGYWTWFALACFALISVSLVLIVFIGALGALQNKALSKAWLIAFVPVATLILYRVFESVGWVNSTSLAATVGIYAVCLEVIVMGVAILWFARNRQGVKERLTALASTDPLTGFSDAQSFSRDLAQVWDSAKQSGADASLVYMSPWSTKSPPRSCSNASYAYCARYLTKTTLLQDSMITPWHCSCRALAWALISAPSCLVLLRWA